MSEVSENRISKAHRIVQVLLVGYWAYAALAVAKFQIGPYGNLTMMLNMPAGSRQFYLNFFSTTHAAMSLFLYAALALLCASLYRSQSTSLLKVRTLALVYAAWTVLPLAIGIARAQFPVLSYPSYVARIVLVAALHAVAYYQVSHLVSAKEPTTDPFQQSDPSEL